MFIVWYLKFNWSESVENTWNFSFSSKKINVEKILDVFIKKKTQIFVAISENNTREKNNKKIAVLDKTRFILQV